MWLKDYCNIKIFGMKEIFVPLASLQLMSSSIPIDLY